MPNLIDIPAIVSTLVTFFATDGDATEAIRGVMVKGVLNLNELKDELLEQPKLRRSVEWFQQHPSDTSAKIELEHCLTEVLNQHRIFWNMEVSEFGKISANRDCVKESSRKYSGRDKGPRVHIDYEAKSIPDDDFFSDSDVRSIADDPFDFSDIGVDRSLPSDIADPKPAKPQKSLSVEFLALAAQGNVSGSACIVDIWACAPDQTEEVRRKAALTGLDAVMGMKAGLSVAAASLLTVSLEIQGMEVPDNIAVIHWQGEAANASFVVSVPQQTKPGRYPGKATISSAGIPIANIVFLFPVCADESTVVTESVGTTHYPRSAFASYASENRADVMERIQGMKVVAPDLDIFLDIMSLRSGQRWLDELEKNIGSRDVFYLFWSQQAAESEWVEKEWRLALAKRGLDYINPVPLDEPDIVPPPSELSGLHFNDAWLGYIKYQTMKTGSPTVSVI